MLLSLGGVSGGVASTVVKDNLRVPLTDLTSTSRPRLPSIGTASAFASAMFGVRRRKEVIAGKQ